MSTGLDKLKHIVVVMMENRSFDHMLGGLQKLDPRINGLAGKETNPDTSGEPAPVKAKAKFQSQLQPDPDHHFPAVHKQIFGNVLAPPTAPTMDGFVKSYWDQLHNVGHSRQIMFYFDPKNLPVLSTLALQFSVFNGWFSSIPGPTICNRAFAHYGTSFGSVGMNPFVVNRPWKSIYDRMLDAGRSAKLYYYDTASSTMEVVNLLSRQPQVFGSFRQFLDDCKSGRLPDYSFIEPNYTDHPGEGGGELIASDQHPDHDVQAGELFLASIYNAIHDNPQLWESTALLITYDEHGGIYDHVPPPACAPDGMVAGPDATGTGFSFAFDRLGVRVPAVLVSPWIAKGTVVAGPEDPLKGRVFEHASIPATVTKFFLGTVDARSPREKKADTFLDLLGDTMRPNAACPVFHVGD